MLNETRKAKEQGNTNRQLLTYYDNISSLSSDEINVLQSNNTHDTGLDNSSSSSTSSTAPHFNTNENVTETQNDAHSLSSSISPPLAPAPPPLIMNESDLQIQNAVAEKLVNEKVQIEQEKEHIEQKLKDLEEREEQINKYFVDLSCKICFISLEINNKFCDDILIKLYHDAAPVTAEYFRSVCIGARGFNYENSTFHYLMPNTFIKGGKVSICTPNGNRFLDKVKKERNGFIHDKIGLLSMGVDDGTTQFFITLGPAPVLNDENVIFGEIVQGIDMLESINKNGIRVATCGDGAASDDEVGGAGATSDDQVGGAPLDKVVIYACGEKK
ncbi:unnamed protein product [Rotaria sp. Silwood2]|nr:unnamed protein product [Rotaria sp. Silwood2]